MEGVDGGHGLAVEEGEDPFEQVAEGGVRVRLPQRCREVLGQPRREHVTVGQFAGQQVALQPQLDVGHHRRQLR